MYDPHFKPVSILAVISLPLGVMALFAFFSLLFLVSAIAAFTVSCLSYFSIRKYGLAGQRMVIVGGGLSLASLTLAPMWHLYLYRAESPLNYQRVDFGSDNILESRDLDQFDNKTICLKGYALAPNRITPMREFRFSPNGDTNKPEDSITVALPFEWDYRYNAIAVSGRLKVNHQAKGSADRYVISAVAIHKSNTTYGLAFRVPRGC